MDSKQSQDNWDVAGNLSVCLFWFVLMLLCVLLLCWRAVVFVLLR